MFFSEELYDTPPASSPRVQTGSTSDSVAGSISATEPRLSTQSDKHYLDEIYDIPKSLSTAPPPSCLGPNTKLHKYINASTKLVDVHGKYFSL